MGKLVEKMLSKNNDNIITITIPVFEEPEVVAKFVTKNKEILQKYPLFVIDRKGGESLKEYADFYKKTSCPTIGLLLGSSRRFLIRKVQTEFTLNLDTDVVLPKNFIEESWKKFDNPRVAAVALDYEKSQGHLAFGPSIWRTHILQKLYDWGYLKTTKCECLYMWDKLHREGYEVETLNMRAKHIKSWGDSVAQNKAGFRKSFWKVVMRILGGIKFNIIKFFD